MGKSVFEIKTGSEEKFAKKKKKKHGENEVPRQNVHLLLLFTERTQRHTKSHNGTRSKVLGM